MQMQLQFILNLDGLRDASRKRAVRVAPLFPDLGGGHVHQIIRICKIKRRYMA